MHPGDCFKRLFEVYCAVVSGMDVSHVTFSYKGKRVHALHTPRALNVHSGEVLQVQIKQLQADAHAKVVVQPRHHPEIKTECE